MLWNATLWMHCNAMLLAISSSSSSSSSSSTWDQKLAMVKTSGLCVLRLALTGLMLMTFMTIKRFQSRFGGADKFGPYHIRPPPFFINFEEFVALDLFWNVGADVKAGVWDIYALEFNAITNTV